MGYPPQRLEIGGLLKCLVPFGSQDKVSIVSHHEIGVIGVVGLGNMRMGMARTLSRDGFSVVGFDISTARLAEADRVGVAIVAELSQLFDAACTIVLSLPTAFHVKAVLVGENGLARRALTPRLIIDTTTSQPDVTRALAARLRALGHRLIDGPVSGGKARAESGRLTVMVGGENDDVARAMTVLSSLGAEIHHVGPVGAGHSVKIVSNILLASHLPTMSEAARLGNAAGVSTDKLIAALNAGSGRSAVSEINYPQKVMKEAFDGGFTMGLMRKDVHLAMELAKSKNLVLPVLAKAGEIWAQSSDTLADDSDVHRMTEYRSDQNRSKTRRKRVSANADAN
ncbi:MAG: NAD(P)-dependent oxidoreductase [Hyphomicrobiales bacterium]